MTHRARLLQLAASVLLVAGSVGITPARAGPEPGDLIETRETAGFQASRAHARALGTTLDPIDPDTVYVGHVFGSTGLPGVPGGAGPYHVGRGGYRVHAGGAAADNGYWDWSRFNSGELDSLQGWWPLNRGIGTTGGVTLGDRQRPFHGLDYGNLGCYVIDQGSPKRTFGVTGYWHADPGALQPGLADTGAAVPGPGVEWIPLSGSRSAWCGLRAHGDPTVSDPITGNPFNQSIVERSSSMFPGQLFGAISPLGTDHNYPGYGGQWDQMLYRDVVLKDGDGLDIAFKWSTALDTRAVTTPSVRVGWFDRDPLKTVALNDTNFISSTDAGANAPVDSFMVYVGLPVRTNSCLYSDRVRRAVGDTLHRWFSEVIAIDAPRYQLLSVAGTHAPSTATIHLAGGAGRPVQAMLDADGYGNGGTLRIVFRVKTNRGYDDGDYGVTGARSGTAGAAIVDDVVVNAWDPSLGDFEAPGAIDNLAPATQAWHSTGKPPGIFFHPHDVATLPYADPCGSIASQSRTCNLTGIVITPGDHDLDEKPGGVAGAPRPDRHDRIDQGIDSEIADVTGDLKLAFDLYTGGLKGAQNGNYYQVAWQCYPARQANGLDVWGEIRLPSVVSSFAGTQCLTVISRGARFDNALVTSNPSGIPDSLRVYLQHVTRCFALPIAGVDCSPATGPNAGIYFDNLAVAFIDAPSLASLAYNGWDLFQDAFPANGDPALLAGVAFDTCAARVKTARNIAQGGGLARPDVPGDTMLVTASGAGQRVDLVFRILPGVGNYVTVGDRSSPIATRPDLVPRVAATPGDGSFWGAYMADNGAFGTGAPMDGVSGGPGHPGGVWDPNRWNSARCDTAEIDLFPADAAGANLSQLTPGVWATMLHESDPKFGALGIAKPRCFLIQPNAGAATDETNITCGGGSYPPAWTAQPGSGFDPNEVPGQPGYTREYTKIIPDGLLTPGSHVEYFFRKSALAAPAVAMLAPDTMRIVPQPVNDDQDGHRWQQFGVLPDRWKDPAFGGQGMACMLLVDMNDRRGDELSWVSAMDSIGGTAAARRGAHNGWKARGDQDITRGVNPAAGGDTSLAVRPHLGQPGTVWDLYSVHGAESGIIAGSLGNRLAAPGTGMLVGKTATSGPTAAMLRAFYPLLVLDIGDLGAGGAPTIGPYAEKTDDDVGLLEDYATGAGGFASRAVWALGRSFAESQANLGTGHPGFVEQFFGASLRSPDYRAFTGSSADVVDLAPQPPLASDGSLYGVLNNCQIDLDVLNLSGLVPGAQIASTISDATAHLGAPPFVSGVWAPSSPQHPYVAQLDAFRLPNLGSRLVLTRGGERRYLLQALTNLFAALNCGPLGSPVGLGDTPFSPDPLALETLRLLSENPWRRGEARLAFQLGTPARAELRVYDLAGRVVRRLADRIFPAGAEQVVTWDGLDDHGRPVSNGVYFYRLRIADRLTDRKVVLLRR
jgi:hypothetical protein